MSGFGSKEKSSQKAFQRTPTDVLLTFLLKTVVPLVPIAAVFYIAGLVMNSEVAGDYSGLAPGVGSMKLTLSEENERLSGRLLLRRAEHFVIVDGKMLDENKMEMRLARQLPGDLQITGVSGRSKVAVASEPGRAQVTVPDLSQREVIKIQATKDQNELNGTLIVRGQNANFSASRASFAAFLGKRWINRTLAYFGFKIKL